MQKQGIVDPLVSHAEQRHEREASSSSKPLFKLQDPPVFIGGIDSMPVVEWLVKMRGKMKADNDLMDTPWRRMACVMNRIGGMAFGHLEPRARDQRARKHGPKPWKDSDEMLAYLKKVFGDLNRRQNAEYEFRILHQEDQEFNTFWAEFLWLSIELDQNDATLISDLTSKLSLNMRLHLINGDEEPTDLFKYAERF